MPDNRPIKSFKEYHFEVPIDHPGGMRLDKYISQRARNVSRTKVQAAIAGDHVTVNNMPRKPSYLLSKGDTIDVQIPIPEPPEARPEKMDLDIIYEDEDLIIVNKSGDRVVHPAQGNWNGTLVNGLLWHTGQLSKQDEATLRPGIVHRLDKDTSGLLVVAKNDEIHRTLSSYFRTKSIERTYWAIIWGTPDQEEGTITGNIGRSPGDRKRMAVVPDDKGKKAVTHYKILEYFDHLSLAEVKLETGRTHQIRVHFAHENHWVLCDQKYGGGTVRYGPNTGSRRQMFNNIFSSMGRQCLHAKTLGFKHPGTGKHMTFDSSLPDDFQQVLDKLRTNGQPEDSRY
jgi:23S rRNA pseudouridine1911/1915/1917 synthase